MPKFKRVTSCLFALHASRVGSKWTVNICFRLYNRLVVEFHFYNWVVMSRVFIVFKWISILVLFVASLYTSNVTCKYICSNVVSSQYSSIPVGKHHAISTLLTKADKRLLTYALNKTVWSFRSQCYFNLFLLLFKKWNPAIYLSVTDVRWKTRDVVFDRRYEYHYQKFGKWNGLRGEASMQHFPPGALAQMSGPRIRLCYFMMHNFTYRKMPVWLLLIIFS